MNFMVLAPRNRTKFTLGQPRSELCSSIGGAGTFPFSFPMLGSLSLTTTFMASNEKAFTKRKLSDHNELQE